MESIDWKNVTDNKQIIELLKQREIIEQQIVELDNMVLIRYELECLKQK